MSGNILKEINALILEREKEEKKEDDDHESPEGGSGDKNNGSLIVDASCTPEDMRFVHDVTLLDEARQKTERIIDCLQHYAPEGYEKPRKEFLTFIQNRKPRERMVRKVVRK